MKSSAISRQPLSVLICSAVNPNLIDGAVIQLISLAETLALAKFDVHVMLRAQIEDRESRLTKNLLSIEGVTIVEPSDSDLVPQTRLVKPHRLALLAEKYVARHSLDLVFARDLEINVHLVRHTKLDGKVCSYLTNIPENHFDLERDPRRKGLITEVANAARIFFIQTEESRSFLEANFPQIAGKTALVPPMIPDSAFLDIEIDSYANSNRPLRLIYAGKFKREWKTLEMTELPARAEAAGAEIELKFLGDKVMNAPADPSWQARMQEALETAPGIEWLGAVDREESIRLVSEADCGLSWRDISVDTSSQLSTKVLEYAAAGTPPLLRRNSTHEEIFGHAYPLFIEGDDVMDTIIKLLADRELLQVARRQAQNAVRPYSFSERAKKLKRDIERVFERQEVFPAHLQKTKMVVAGYDFKFMGELLEFFAKDESVEVEFDKWPGTTARWGAASRATRESADVIFAEWCTSSAVWYSHHKLPHQKLVIRLHRFEMTRPWPFQLNLDNVDALVVIAPHMAEKVIGETGIDPEKVHLIPNSINTVDLARPKAFGAQFQIGMLGMIPVRKRPDRALELLRELRKFDDRFTLHFRGRLPSSYFDFTRNTFFRTYYQDLFRQFSTSGDLYGSVYHDRFGADIANWFRRVGWILSPSTDEGSHQAVAEGMASGTVPLIWNWEGADRVYPAEHVYVDDPKSIAAHVIETVRSGDWERQGVAAAEFVGRYDTDVVHNAWKRLFHAIRP